MENAPTAGFDSKKIVMLIVGAVVIVGIIAVAYFLKVKVEQKNEENTTLESAVEGAIPSLSNNPLEGRPNLNPADNTNPFKNVKTNPFE